MQLAYHGLGFVDAMTQYVVLYILSFTFVIFIFGSTYITYFDDQSIADNWIHLCPHRGQSQNWFQDSVISEIWFLFIPRCCGSHCIESGQSWWSEPFQQIVRACESSIWEPGLDWNIWEIRPHSDKFHQFSELAEAGKHCIGAETVINIKILLENVS